MVNAIKKEKVSKLMDLVEKHPNFVIVGFDKTPHKKLEDLRVKLYNSGSRLRVLKNSLFKKTVYHLSIKDRKYSSIKDQADNIANSTMLFLLGEDWSESIKTFHDFSKSEKSLKFKFAFIEDTSYNATQLDYIANLPGKSELIGKIIGSTKSPSSKIVMSMKNPIQKILYILKERSDKNSASEAEQAS